MDGAAVNMGKYKGGKALIQIAKAARRPRHQSGSGILGMDVGYYHVVYKPPVGARDT